MRPRLLHVTTSDMSLDLLLGPQLEAFARAGYEVLTASAAGPHADALATRGIPHEPLRHASRSLMPSSDGRAFGELVRLFSRLRPDIVHTHNPKTGVLGRIAAKAARVPVVVNTQHGLYAQPGDPWPRRLAVYALERLAAACSHAELVQSPEDLETLARLGVPRERLHLLGNGIDLGRFDPDRVDGAAREALRRSLGIGPNDVLCGAVGRLVVEKGYRELFAAMERLAAAGVPVRLVVAGPAEPDKPDALDPREIAEATRLGAHFLGMRDDMPELYRAMDVYVLASHREGFPRSAMEAAAMGLPVVATDIRGCRHVVDDGVTGFLVPRGDVAALAERIRRLAADPALRARFGAAARRKARAEFDQQRVIDTTLEVYERLLASRGRRPALAGAGR
jgi:glycosyltransferase involved in cell wall biosynthesis